MQHSNSRRRVRRSLVAVAAASAIVIMAGSAPAFAAGGVITGKVTATPAKYLEESVVYLESAPATPPQTATMDQGGMKFIPHVLAIQKGDTVKFLNHDTVAHNVFSSDFEGYNLGTFKQNEVRTHAFAGKSNVAYSQLCSIHPEMLGFIFVGQNRYSAVVDKEGRFTLKDVPAGTYQVAIWNSHLKAPEQSVTVAAGASKEVNFALHR